MKQVQKGYVYYVKYDFEDEPRLRWHSTGDMGDDAPAWVLIGPHDIELECPDDFDPRPQQVAAIDAVMEKTRADFAARITELQEQKNKLLCLEMAS